MNQYHVIFMKDGKRVAHVSPINSKNKATAIPNAYKKLNKDIDFDSVMIHKYLAHR